MFKIAAKNEKVFGFYQFLSADVRMEIVNEMSMVDRCRFSGCSKSSNSDVRISKNYMYSLEINLSAKCPNIIVRHGQYDKMARKSCQGYTLTFNQELGIVECRSLEWKTVLWTSEFDSSSDFHQCVYQRFRNLLQKHQNNIKSLVVDVSNYNDILPEIQSLNRLEKLQVFDDTNILELLSKTPKTLSHLYVVGEKNGRLLESCEKIYRVRTKFYSPETRLNYTQFLRFTASDVTIHIGQMIPMDIFSIVRAWQDGRIDFDCYDWYLHGSNFDLAEFFGLLGVDLGTLGQGNFSPIDTIKHDRDNRKTMKIYIANFGQKNRTLTLQTYNKC